MRRDILWGEGSAVSGQLVKDVARHFGRSPMTMSRAVVQFEERLRNDQ
jgi:transposase-like protein